MNTYIVEYDIEKTNIFFGYSHSITVEQEIKADNVYINERGHLLLDCCEDLVAVFRDFRSVRKA